MWPLRKHAYFFQLQKKNRKNICWKVLMFFIYFVVVQNRIYIGSNHAIERIAETNLASIYMYAHNPCYETSKLRKIY